MPSHEDPTEVTIFTLCRMRVSIVCMVRCCHQYIPEMTRSATVMAGTDGTNRFSTVAAISKGPAVLNNAEFSEGVQSLLLRVDAGFSGS